MGLSLVAAMTTLAVTFPELSDAEVWQEIAFIRADELMGHLVLDDGAYTEHTMGYPFPVLGMMLDLLDFCKEQKAPLPPSFSIKTHQLARYLMNVSMPDGVPPNWGEGSSRSSKNNISVQRAAEYFKDQQLLWWCGLSKEEHLPGYASLNYPDAKIALFRSGWDTNALVMFVSPRVGGGHYHVDQNHLSLSAYGSKLLVDTGMSSYSGSHPHFDWQRHQGKSHNTVEVDGKGYPRFEKKDRGRNYEGDCSSKLFVCDKVEYFQGSASGYPNVLHERSIMYLKEPGLYLVADIMTPKDNGKHIYDQCWHLHPELEFTVSGKDRKIGTSRSGKANLDLVGLYPVNPEILIRNGFNAKPLGDTRYPSFRQECEGVARFYTLLYPKRGGAPSTIHAKPIKISKETVAFEFDLPGGKGIYMQCAGESKDVEIENITVHAEFAYLQFNHGGTLDYAALLHGRQLLVDGRKVEFVELEKSNGEQRN